MNCMLCVGYMPNKALDLYEKKISKCLGPVFTYKNISGIYDNLKNSLRYLYLFC